MKRAFFAGAWELYQIVMQQMSPGQDVTEDDVYVMQSVHDEMVSFHNDVVQGRQ